MIKLKCIDETGQEDYTFKIVKGESYEPLGHRKNDGIWYYLIFPYPFLFVWYEERMFEPVPYLVYQ